MYHDVTRRDTKSPEPPPPRPEDDEPEPEKERKERVLHTRVPALLEDELKRFAENLRVPVSNLVRNILEEALDIADVAAETVESRLHRAASSLKTGRERVKARVA